MERKILLSEVEYDLLLNKRNISLEIKEKDLEFKEKALNKREKQITDLIQKNMVCSCRVTVTAADVHYSTSWFDIGEELKRVKAMTVSEFKRWKKAENSFGLIFTD